MLEARALTGTKPSNWNERLRFSISTLHTLPGYARNYTVVDVCSSVNWSISVFKFIFSFFSQCLDMDDFCVKHCWREMKRNYYPRGNLLLLTETIRVEMFENDGEREGNSSANFAV